jgi:hypothetical protein
MAEGISQHLHRSTLARVITSTATMIVTLVLLPGCGSGGGGSHVSAAKLENCLTHLGFTVSPRDADYIAQDAGDGGFLVNLYENTVNVAVERTSGDAKHTLAAYETFANTAGGADSASLYRDGNAVFAWDKTPTENERKAVDQCER